jgi:hypothetical protein
MDFDDVMGVLLHGSIVSQMAVLVSVLFIGKSAL